MSVEKTLCSSAALNFGECNASSFEAKIVGIQDLSGVKIQVLQYIGDYEVWIFTGVIDSCKKENNKSSRELVAYDDFYKLFDTDVIGWYNDIFNASDSYSIKEFRTSLCEYLDIEQEDTTLVNDSVTIQKTISSSTLKAKDVMYAICQINGVFGHISPTGKIQYIGADSGAIRDIGDNVRGTSSHQEYITQNIEQLLVVTEDDELNVSVGAGNNAYTVKGNFLLYGSEQIREAATNLFEKIRNISYRPSDTEMILSEPDIEIGDIVIYEDDGIEIQSLVTSISLSGTQLLTQKLVSAGNEFCEGVNDADAEIKELQLKFSKIYEVLEAEYLKVTTAEAEYLSAKELTAVTAKIEKVVIEDLSSEFANVHLGNIDIADIGEFFADSGILKDVTIVDGAVTGVLKGVRIIGDVIEANTIKADSLILSGSEDSLIYQINVSSSGLSLEELSDEVYKQKLNGTDLVANSVTANELAANSVTAEKILAGAITAEKLNVSSLSAISANLGTVTAGVMKSANYVAGTSGMEINLNMGTWTGQYFSIDTSGKMIATGGKLGKWEIGENGLYYEDGIVAIEVTPPTSDDGNFIALYTYDEDLGAYATDSYWAVDGKGYGVLYTHEYQGTLADIQQIDAVTIGTQYLTVTQDFVASSEGNVLSKDYICHTMNAGSGSTGYWRFARITVTGTYANAPMEFTIVQRVRKGTLQVALRNASTAAAHSLSSACQNGSLCQAYVVSVGSGVFDLYLTKGEAYDSASVTGIEISKYQRSLVDITWYNEYISALPSGAKAAEYKVQETLAQGVFASVETAAGANLDTLKSILDKFNFGGSTTAAKRLSFLDYCYYNNTAAYGFTLRWGGSSLGGYVDDTYWISVRYDGLLAVGYQLNGATKPTWVTK